MGVLSRYSNNAQSCIAAKRFYIAESIADKYIAAFVEKAKALRVGDPMKTDTQLVRWPASISAPIPNAR